MIEINGKKIAVNKGESYEHVLKKHFGKLANITCVLENGVVRELTDPAGIGKVSEFLSADRSEEAARVYVRGLIFLAFRAVRRIYGDQAKLIVEHSLSSGHYCEIEGVGTLTPQKIVKIEELMSRMADENTKFVYHKVPKDIGIKLFEKDGQKDKVKLFKYRPLNFMRYYENCGSINYFYGQMVPSTGYLKNFKLFHYAEGFVIKSPVPFRAFSGNLEKEPKLYDVISTAEKWAKVLKVSNVADINKLSDLNRLSEFIKVNEALHESSIADIAKEIVARKDARIVLISGPSSSGKTTFAGRLKTHLMALGKCSHSVSLDDYYIDRDALPMGENGKKDFETIDALDTHLFNENMISLLDGKETDLPIFSFPKGKRDGYKTRTITDDELLIVEGIHGLNEELTRLVPKKYKFKIFISPLTTLNLDNHNIVYPEDLRLLRRMVRDKRTRGYSIETTLSMWHDVRHGEFKYILPYKENADVMFNSTLIYEPMILKKYAMEELMKIKKDAPEYRFASKLIKFLNYFASSDLDDEIAKNSLLREFIG
jgi:uridine kinase